MGWRRNQRHSQTRQRARERRRNGGGISPEEARNRCRRREHQTEQALQLLQELGCIRHYEMSEPLGERDQKGIDASFVSLDGELVGFQIKGCRNGVMQHMRKHPRIPCINLEGYVHAADVAVLLQRTFGLYAPGQQPL